MRKLISGLTLVRSKQHPVLASRRRFLFGAAALASTAAFPLLLRGQTNAQSTRVLKASDFGAVGDGRTNSIRALSNALASGNVIDGEGRHYAIAGNLEVKGSFKGLVNARLHQLTPGGDSRRTLMIDRCSDFILENVEVYRGGTGAEHADIKLMGKNAGIYVTNCRDFALRGVKASGGGIGSGIVIVHSSRFSADDLEAWNIWYDLPRHPDDDAIQGIYVGDCQNFTVRNGYAHDIGGIANGKSTHDNNRGFAIGGCSEFQLIRPRAVRVGQGVDTTGVGNRQFKYTDGLAEDCYSWGFKFANAAFDGSIENSTARRCGLGGFVASSRAEAGNQLNTHSIAVTACVSEDTTGNPPRVNGEKRQDGIGFWVLGYKGPNALVPTYPRNITFSQCVARARAPDAHMVYGFKNDIPSSRSEGQPNRVLDCHAEGWTRAAFEGFDV